MASRYKSLEHYEATYDQHHRGIHSIPALQSFYGEVLLAAYELQYAYNWRFWKWWQWGPLIYKIEKEHRLCCKIKV